MVTSLGVSAESLKYYCKISKERQGVGRVGKGWGRAGVVEFAPRYSLYGGRGVCSPIFPVWGSGAN